MYIIICHSVELHFDHRDIIYARYEIAQILINCHCPEEVDRCFQEEEIAYQSLIDDRETQLLNIYRTLFGTPNGYISTAKYFGKLTLN